MKLLVVHPSCLMYSKIYLRLEPLGLELVAAAAREAGHSVRLIDLQCESHQNFFRLIRHWRPDVIAFSGNYLANVPEIIDLARATRALLPTAFISVGGHSVSFIPEEILRHTEGAVDCVLIGEGETAITSLLDALAKDRANLREVPGCVTLDHRGPPPTFVKSLDDLLPARDIVRHRRKYFIGQLDPAASIEFSRGCPWDCVFCSAWTFYGRNYRVNTGARGRGTGTSARAGNFYRGRRSLHSSRARYAAWRSDCPPRNQETLLSRNARRCALAQQEGLRTLEATWPEYHVPRS